MNEAPERLWAWSFNSCGEGWGGYARMDNFHALDKREELTGAEYIRKDVSDAQTKAAVEAEREACAEICDVEADKCDDAVKWGGSKRYVQDCKAASYAIRDRAAAIRARSKP